MTGSVDNGHLRYQDARAGLPVVLLHGGWFSTTRKIARPTGGDYPVVVSRRAATPVRFEHAVGDRLADEGLRMVEHPNIVFRDGPTGRRAGLVGGPDVWEIIRAVRSARAAEPDLDADEVVALVEETTGVPAHLVRAAVDYWADHPADVDAWVARADVESLAAEERWRREQRLLAG